MKVLYGAGPVVLVAMSAFFVSSEARAQLGATVPDWGARSHRAARTMGDVTLATPFVGVTPCRIVDTRAPAGTFGGPALAAGAPRDFPLLSGPCAGLPPSVQAYSLNITVTNTLGPGFIQLYPKGASAPLVSTMNYVAGQTLANAAIVPAGIGSAITAVAGVSGTDLIIDIDGYFTYQMNSGNNLSVETSAADPAAIFGLDAGGVGIGVVGVGGTGSWSGFRAGTGVLGVGTKWGVQANSQGSGAGAAGVFGYDVSGDPPTPAGLSAGVYGASNAGYGVWGVSKVTAVKGSFLDSGGTPVSAGYLGHDATNGVYSSGNITATGTKSFAEPHPAKAGAAVVYVALEGPEAGTYFRGRGHIHDGSGVVSVPESFRLVSSEDGLTVQVTPIGDVAAIAVVSADLNTIVVQSVRRELDFYYTVNGVRKSFEGFDPMAQPDYFVPETPDARMPASFTPEQRRRLIANGTYNADGTVNMDTAQKMGWTRIWADREARARAAASASDGVVGSTR
jgi:hypothetical protein